VNAEFNVWLLIVGLVVGAGLVWLVIMDTRRREVEVDAVERPREAAWLSAVMVDDGFDVSPAAAERMLELHRAYLEAPPPDPPPAEADGEASETDDAAELDEGVAELDERADETQPRGGV
jgi:hypothetical protein